MTNVFFNAKAILSRDRYPWIDYARGISIILVCYRHIFEGLVTVGQGSLSYPMLKYLNIFFFSFRMPLFFIVSGVFLGGSLKRKGLSPYIQNRFQTIFYPMLIWGTLQISLQLMLKGLVNTTHLPIDYLRLLYMPRNVEQFWYLNALFFVSLLYAVTKVKLQFKPWHNLIVGIVFFAIAGYYNHYDIEIGFLSDVFFFYLFFAIGDNVASFMLNPANYRYLASPWTTLVLLPVFVGMQHLFTVYNIDNGDDYYVQHYMPALFAISALVGGAFVINVSYLLQRFNLVRFLRVIGYHSLYIYVVHLLVTSATRIFMVRVLGIDNVPVIMITSLITGISIPIIFYNLTQRAGYWWLFSLKKTPEAIAAQKIRENRQPVPQHRSGKSNVKTKESESV